MGQDEYLSQGTFNYAENIDLYRQNAFFTPSISHVTHGKTTDNGIFNIEGIGIAGVYAFSNSWKVYFVPQTWVSPYVGFNPDTDTPDLVQVINTGVNFSRHVEKFIGRYFIFRQNHIREIVESSINWSNPWTMTDSYEYSVQYPDNWINYLDARLYFSHGSGNDYKLAKLDEYAAFTDNVLGDRAFWSRIVWLTITWSVLNIYQENGEKTMLDIASETIIETINLGRSLHKVLGINNRDYVISSYDNNARKFISLSSWYELVDVVKQDNAYTLEDYNIFGTLDKKYSKYKINTPWSGRKFFDNFEGNLIFIDDYNLNLLRPDNTIIPLVWLDVEWKHLSNIGAICYDNSKVLMAYESEWFTQMIGSISTSLGSGEIRAVKSFLAENIFTGWDITRKKELVSFRLRADIPYGTRWKLKAICDWETREVCEIIWQSGWPKVHTYRANNVNWYEIMFVYELFWDETYATNEYIRHHEMEIAYNFIQE